MANKKISDLTEITSADSAVDFLPVVDSSESKTKKIKLANFPLSDASKDTAYPYTIDIQNGVEQTRNLTTISNSDGYNNNTTLAGVYIGSNVTSIGHSAFDGCSNLP